MGLHILNLLNEGSVASVSDYSLNGLRLNSKYVFRRKIGAGTFGLIYLVEDSAGIQYAAKILLRERGPAEKNMESVYRTFASPSAVEELDLDKLVERGDGDWNKCLYSGTNDSSKEKQPPSHDLEAREKLGHLFPFRKLLPEVALHYKVHGHQNIASLHHVYTVQDTALVVVMEYFPHGDLFGAIIDGQIFSNPPPTQNRQLLMKNCMLQLIDAIHHCASHSVFHCDLKPENIMVSYDRNYVRKNDDPVDYNELRVFLIDFGLAMSSDLVCCNVCRGSNFYMAPERIVNFNTNKLVQSLMDMGQFQRGYSAHGHEQVFFPTLAGDIWSLGVLFINVTCARNPWPIANIDDRQDVFFTYILRDNYVLSTILPISKQYNELLNRIFTLNPNERASLGSLAHMIRVCDFFSDSTRPLDPDTVLEDVQLEVSARKDLPKRACAEVAICKPQLSAFQAYDHSRYVS